MSNLIFLKATKEIFAEYGVTITTERHLSDGEYIKHVQLTNSLIVIGHLDARITPYTQEAMVAFLEFVEGDGVEQ